MPIGRSTWRRRPAATVSPRRSWTAALPPKRAPRAPELFAEYELQQPGDVVRRRVGLNAQLLGGKIEAVHPVGGITEALGAIRIPAAEGREHDLLLLETEPLHAELVGTRFRL